MADRKLKYTRDLSDGTTESKTLSNINPESDTDALLETVNQLASLQNDEVSKVELIETTVISG